MTPEKLSEESNLQIVAYPNMSAMPEQTLQKLAAKEREWFGYGMEGRGFGEYAICSDANCRRILSVEDVYPQIKEAPDQYIPLNELEKDGAKLPCCPDCNGKMELLLDPEFFPKYLRLYFSQKVYGALLMDGDEVKGAVSAFKATFEDAFMGNVNYRQSYDLDEVLERVASLTGKTPDEIRAQVVANCNRLGIDKDIRGQGHLAKLASTALNQHPENDEFPSLGDARIIGPVYPFAVASGYEPIAEDEYGNALFYAEKFAGFRDFFNLTTEEFLAKNGEKLKKVRAWQKQRVAEFKKKDNVRRIKGVPLLREVFEQSDEDKPSNAFETKEGKKFTIETVNSEELDEEKLTEMIDFFRFIFNNTFAGQYLVYPSVGQPISTQEVFGTQPDEFVSLEKLDSFDPKTYPKHPETGESAVFWHDPKVTIEKFAEKSKQNAHYAVFRNLETGEIAGIMFGHKCSIKDLFASEEWENPLLYSGVEIPENMRSFEEFLIKLNKNLKKKGLEELNAESEVYGWNCIATHPDVRGLEHLTKLTKTFFEMIPQEMKDELLIVGETKYATRAHALFKTAGGIDITGILTDSDKTEKGDPVIIVGPLDYAAKIFCLSQKEFEEMMKTC